MRLADLDLKHKLAETPKIKRKLAENSKAAADAAARYVGADAIKLSQGRVLHRQLQQVAKG